MKIIHVTDIHLTGEGGTVLERSPGHNFLACLDHIVAHHADADLCVITGDLAHWGEREAYEHLQQILSPFPIETRLMIGNHDDRQIFQAVFPDTPSDANGFVQWSEATKAGRFIYLDTTEPGTHAGHFGHDRQQWLRAELENLEDEACYLFMHHHPSPIGIRAMDDIGQVNAPELRAILHAHRSKIAHIFFGHCHLPLSGTVCGIPFAALRGTNHHGWQDFTGSPRLKGAELTPAYNVVLLENGDCVIHTIDFTYAGPIAEFGTRHADWAREPEAAV
ncbi:MAG: phosphodiesterase [Hyphomicrobiaceae bacterium]|nr:phosphodiesterase [Hyphomicrobiaceae bacterium]